MSVEFEGLSFQIEATTDNAAKGIDALATSFNNLKKALNNTNFESFSKSLESISTALNQNTKTDTLAQLATTLNRLTGLKISSTIPERLTEISLAINTIDPASVTNLDKLADVLLKMQGASVPAGWGSFAKAATSGTGASANALTTATTSVSTSTQVAATPGISSLGTTASAATQNVSLLQAALQRVTSTAGSAASGFTGIVTSLQTAQASFSSASGVIGTFRNALNLAGTAVTGLAKTISSKLTRSFKNLASLPTAVTNGFKSLLNSMGRVAAYRTIRTFFSQLTSAMKDGIDNLYNYSTLMGGKFKDSMDSLATSWQYLKNSLGAVAAPIINTLAPAVDLLVDKFVSLLNIVNQFIARLTGSSTYTVAKKAAASYADSLTDVADATSEVEKATTGIDELNIISDDSSSDDTTDYSSMFETITIANSISDFADQLKAALEASDWKALGTTLGNKLNEIIDSVDWAAAGKSIGSKLNAAIQTAYYLVDTVDFKNIGSSIATYLNAGIGAIDWTYLGGLLVKGITSVFDILIGAVTTLNWSQIGSSISDALKGAFNEVATWFKSYDWSALGTSLWQSLKDLVTGIDWGGVATSLFTALGSAIRAGAGLLWGFISGIGADIKSWWISEIAAENWLEVASNLFSAIGQGFVNIGSWVLENIVNPFMNALLGEDVWADIKQVGVDIWNGFVEGIKSFFSGIYNFVKTYIVDPVVDGVKSLFGIASPSTVMMEIGKDIVRGLYEGIKALISDGIAIIMGWAGDIIDWFTGGDGEGNIIEKFINLGGSIVSGFWGKVSSTYTDAKNAITTWAGKVKDWFTDNVNVSTFVTYASNFVTGFKDKVSNAYTNAQSAITTWASKVKTWFTDNVNVSTFATYASNIVTGFKDKVSSVYTNVQTSITTWAGKVKDWFTDNVSSSTFATYASNIVTGFKDKVTNVYSNVQSAITTWASNVKTWFTGSSYGAANSSTFQTYASNIVTGFKDKVSSVYTNVKSSITTWASYIKNCLTSDSYGGVNSSTFQTYASNIVSGFKTKLSSTYTNVKTSITTWASNLKSWFTSTSYGGVCSSSFQTYASNVITGFKSKISSAYTNAKSAVTTWASNVKTWFTNYCSSSSFYTLASNVITGFTNGIGNLYSTCKDTISSWGSSIISWFKGVLGINSPSKVFSEFGGFVVEGLNSGITSEGSSTASIVSDWADSFTDITPTLALAVDTSALAYYDSDAFASTISSNVQSNTEVSVTGFKQVLEDFFTEHLESMLTQIADDTRRQADKDENPVIKIGGRTITAAIEAQTKANGYSFT